MARSDREGEQSIPPEILARDDEIFAAFMARRPSELEYLRRLEALARDVRDAASAERGDSIYEDEDQSPLDLAITRLVRNIRQQKTR